MNFKRTVRNIETGAYAVATSNFSAYTKSNLSKSPEYILGVKTGDMFLIIEKNLEQYPKWPIKVLTEEHGALYINNLDAHHFVYVRCGDNLVNKSFCITGELSHPRAVYQKIIEMNGGSFKTTISKSLNYLISNESRASTKMVKAQESGVAIISEYDFLAMVG